MPPISSTNDPVFIDPLTDVGFRHSFASDGSQPLLKEFISLFIGNEVGPVCNVEFLPNAISKKSRVEQKIILDVFCKSNGSRYYIVEMQRVRNRFPIDRGIAYASRVLSNNLKIVNKRHVIPKVHTICLMEHPDNLALLRNKWMWSAKLRDEDNRIISDNPTFHFLELGIFARQKIEPKSLQELWLHLFCNMCKFEDIPKEAAGNEILEQLFDRCRFDNLTDMEKDEYRKNILDYADVQDALEKVKDDSFQNGLIQGIAEGEARGRAEGEAKGEAKGEARAKLAMAKSMLQKGIDRATILAITGLTAQEIGA